MTTTSCVVWKPSISTRSWLSVWSRSPVMSLPRWPPTASSSSMKTMQGACLRATPNKRRIRAAPRPANISTNAAADWEKKFAPDSCATALASSVLPVPGGPCSRIPLGTRAPRRRKRWGSLQELDHLAQLLLGLVGAGDVIPRHLELAVSGRICCGLVRGTTLSVRQTRKTSSAMKMSGSHVSANDSTSS